MKGKIFILVSLVLVILLSGCEETLTKPDVTKESLGQVSENEDFEPVFEQDWYKNLPDTNVDMVVFEIDESDTYPKEELEKISEQIVENYKDTKGLVLEKIKYDKDFSDKQLDFFEEGDIVFALDFHTVNEPDMSLTGFGPDTYYQDYMNIFEKNKSDGSWNLINHSY